MERYSMNEMMLSCTALESGEKEDEVPNVLVEGLTLSECKKPHSYSYKEGILERRSRYVILSTEKSHVKCT